LQSHKCKLGLELGLELELELELELKLELELELELELTLPVYVQVHGEFPKFTLMAAKHIIPGRMAVGVRERLGQSSSPPF